MSDVQSNTSNAFQQLREISELITRLKQLDKFVREIFPQHQDPEVRDALGKAIEILTNGEPFHPEPRPSSGQGGWRDTAVMMSNNADFYQGIVKQVGEILGVEAYTADDGTVGDSVLALKVPELVKELKERLDDVALNNQSKQS